MAWSHKNTNKFHYPIFLIEICNPNHDNMNKEELRIIFFGTPDFAAFSLEKLINNGFNIVSVVTAPDKPAGRGLQIQESAVKIMAKEHNISILQPTNLKSEDFIQTLISYNADLQIVIAFRMLPESVWSLPKLGTFNLHASLLPNYRGAAPINHAIINGEETTGVSTFFIEKQIDTGKILLQSNVNIESSDNAQTLHDKLMKEGANIVIKTIEGILENKLMPMEQIVTGLEKIAPKLSPEFCVINWSKKDNEIRNFVRGLSPYPVARTFLNQKMFKIFNVEVSDENPKLKEGEWSIQSNRLYIGTKTISVEILEIQQEGKKRMKVKDFLTGFRL
jgi:methionyl-tRNA formyltransferase